MKIPNTLNLISQCWKQAEEQLQADIREDYPGANEEFITQMFHGKFSKILRVASKEKRIESSFQKDLQEAWPNINSYNATKISNGLIAEIILHRRSSEAITGGDIGLVISRPLIEKHGYEIKDYRRGLLCQAKLKKGNNKWNRLSPSQLKRLNERMQYLGLLLYEYNDLERRELKYFDWQLCQNAQGVIEVGSWLKAGHFPSLIDSKRVISELGNGNIGTDNEEILEKIIAPKRNTILEIVIRWPDDKKPGSYTLLSTINTTKLESQVVVKISH